MVPPPRNYAADAHECIMGSGRKARRIQGCGAMIGRPRQVPLAIFASPNRWPLRGLRTSSSGANPHERRASSSVENPPEREGAHAHVRLDEGARPVDERRPLSSCAWEGRKIKREMGVISSAADRRRWPDPCKGWPSATASGGFGLDKRLASDILRRQGFDGQERASSGPPTRLPGPDTTQIFLLTKKTSYKVG
jgi:hypothetical protein